MCVCVCVGGGGGGGGRGERQVRWGVYCFHIHLSIHHSVCLSMFWFLLLILLNNLSVFTLLGVSNKHCLLTLLVCFRPLSEGDWCSGKLIGSVSLVKNDRKFTKYL